MKIIPTINKTIISIPSLLEKRSMMYWTKSAEHGKKEKRFAFANLRHSICACGGIGENLCEKIINVGENNLWSAFICEVDCAGKDISKLEFIALEQNRSSTLYLKGNKYRVWRKYPSLLGAYIRW